MVNGDTVRKLADMTDEGVFERLATAILRESEPRFHYLSHPGVNAEGKTVKSPLDGIAFVPGSVPPQMIAVHHTACKAKDLQNKWLHDPATVKPRGKSKTPTAPAGDVVKTVELINEERKRTPDVQATLVLTTNQEPGQELVREVHAAGAAAGITIDIWHRSRLAHFLDNEPRGQWLRGEYFGIDQVQLSPDLLTKLSKASLQAHKPPDQTDAWVDRRLDHEIEQAKDDDIVFVIAESGTGKSIACYKRLQANVSAGGFGLVLSHEIIASSLSIEQAIEKALVQLHPSLISGSGSTALQMSRPGRRLLLTVEDINRSGRAPALIERIARWSGEGSKKDGAVSWQLLCPVWPKVMASLGEEARRRINSQVISGSVFSADEGALAVERRRSVQGRPVTKLQAASISAALGHDPLLIALHDPSLAPDTSQTIGQFVESNIQILASAKGEFLAAEYRKALGELAKSMLARRQLEPDWLGLLTWPSLADHAMALRHVAHHGEIIRLTGRSSDEKLTFRHDRVREWLLADAAAEMLRENAMPDDVAGEPYFAEIFGLALARSNISPKDVAKMAALNVLALFCAIRHFGEGAKGDQRTIVTALEGWLNQTPLDSRRNRYLRWEAMRALSEAEGPDVRPLVGKFDDRSWNCLRARYRNGDLMGGIELCIQTEPGVSVAGLDAFFEHVKARYGANLIKALDELLRKADLSDSLRIGALRLAGHLGEAGLADAVRTCWNNHDDRNQHLGEYLWACGECVDDDPTTLLKPVCDGWAALPNTHEEGEFASPRENLAGHNIRWAFHKRLPDGAVRYFIERAADPDLKWPITYMLHGLDHPDAVEFVVRELSATAERLAGSDQFSPFVLSAKRDWERHQETTGRPMSAPSRARLLTIWQDHSAGKYLRKQAFQIWASTQAKGDIEILRVIDATDALADDALWHRMRRGDHGSIPLMIAKVLADEGGYWWQLGRYIWSDELTKALEDALGRRTVVVTEKEDDNPKGARADWILSEMVMRLPVPTAERLLIKHWNDLRTSHYFVIAALYVATPPLRSLVAAAVKDARNPKELLRHLTMRFGHKRSGHPGLSRPEQIESVLPYLDLLEEMEIHQLWAACNEHGWFDMRRAHLDARLTGKARDRAYLDDANVINALDEFLAKKDPWIDYWLEAFIESGASLDHIMSVLVRWVEGKSTIAALELASGAVLRAGERRHVGLFKAAKIEPVDLADAVLTDMEFGVKRRTLQG